MSDYTLAEPEPYCEHGNMSVLLGSDKKYAWIFGEQFFRMKNFCNMLDSLVRASEAGNGYLLTEELRMIADNAHSLWDHENAGRIVQVEKFWGEPDDV